MILVVETTYPAQLIVDVTFEGTQTSGSGIQSTTTEKPVVYYNAEIDALIVEGAENQKYNIYNITGVQTPIRYLKYQEINVTAFYKEVYI